jgi:hypothetical protein
MPPVFGTPANLQHYLPSVLYSSPQFNLGAKTRICLLGEHYFGNMATPHASSSANYSHIASFHALLEARLIPHVYNDTINVNHAWNTGWVPAALHCLESLMGPHQASHQASQGTQYALSLGTRAGATHGDGFESYHLGSTGLCDKSRYDNYHCIRGADQGQRGPPSPPTVVQAPEPVRSGKHSLRSGPFTFEEGYRVEVIPKNSSEASEGYVVEGFGVPAWYGFR